VYVPENVFRGIFVSVERFLKSEMFATELVDMLSFPCLVSIDKARKELGYEPEYKVKDIVENITFFD
jgi:nucleoside-diphosphate-sugar epimerase